MDHKEKELLRQAMDVQFRHKLYQEPRFKYLRSFGCLDIFQAFGNKEVGFIGFLHLKWVRDDYYESIWYDTMEEGNRIRERVSKEHPLDPEKLASIFLSSINGDFKERWTKLEEKSLVLN